jgi:uridine kinase
MNAFIVGLAGGSGSGKTTLARCIQAALLSRADILYQDSYYIDQSHRFDGDGGSVNFDHPESLEFSLLAQHLEALRQGHSIKIPQYDFATHTRLQTTLDFAPTPIVLLDGTLLLSQPQVCEALDLKIFIETQEEIRFARRLERDVRERGRTPEGVRKQFDLQVKPMHDQFVEGSKRYADLVLCGDVSVDQHLEKILQKLPTFS